MTQNSVVEAVRQLVEPIVEDLGLELVEVTYGNEQGRWILRLTIDGPEGIGHEECRRVSEAVDGPLDEADPVPGSYYLEVSSPGLDRPLVKPEHFVRFAGERVRIRTAVPIDGRRNWTGRLNGLDGDKVLLTVDGGQEAALPLEQMAGARLVPDLS